MVNNYIVEILILYKKYLPRYDPIIEHFFNKINSFPIPNNDKVKLIGYIFKENNDDRKDNYIFMKNRMNDIGIGSYIIWGKTKEGHDYWNNINQRICDTK